MRHYTSRPDLGRRIRDHHPAHQDAAVWNWPGQLWGFLDRMDVGDLVVSPAKDRRTVLIGEVTGPYRFRPDLPAEGRQTRSVRWIRRDLPRDDLPDAIRDGLRARSTIREIKGEQAEKQLRALIE